MNWWRKRDKTSEVVNKKRNEIQIKGLNKLTPQWISLRSNIDLMNAYYSTPPLFNVINYEANLFSKCKFKHYKKTGDKYTEIKNSILIKKLENPNPLQTGKEWLIQNYIFWQVFGSSVIYNVSLTPYDYTKTVNLWNLPMQELTFELSDKIWTTTDLSEIIEKIKFNPNNTAFDIDKIILQNESNIDFKNGRYTLGKSKIIGIQKNISNIAANLTSRNVLLEKRGAIGILSNESSDDAGFIPVQDEDRKAIQEDFHNNYGLTNSQFQLIITDAKLKWQAMSIPIKDMMLEEQYKRDKIEICDAYTFPILLLNENEGATFSNLDAAKKQVFENKIIPDWGMFENNLNNYFKLEDKNEYLEVCYDHIEVLQKDKKVKLETAKLENEIILNIQTAVHDNIVSQESAINQLVDLLEYDYDKAKKILSFKKDGQITAE